jgi:hypothetical protein
MNEINLEMLTKATERMNRQEQENHFVICTGKGLLANGICSFNGKQIDPDKRYMVELNNYPFNINPTDIKAL